MKIKPIFLVVSIVALALAGGCSRKERSARETADQVMQAWLNRNFAAIEALAKPSSPEYKKMVAKTERRLKALKQAKAYQGSTDISRLPVKGAGLFERYLTGSIENSRKSISMWYSSKKRIHRTVVMQSSGYWPQPCRSIIQSR